MNHQDIRTLKILEAIEKKPRLRQRYLAKHLDISLGLVNSFLKRLVQNGYCSVRTKPKHGNMYMLTQKGLDEKVRLTYAYIQFSLSFYSDAHRK